MPKNEELVGAQHKLDHNKDGKISGDDFKGLRKKAGKKEKQETGTVNPKMDSSKSSKGSEMEQKESTIRQRLMSIWEKAGDQMEKKKHSPNQDKAEKPEDALTGQGAKDMMNQPKDVQEPLVKAVADQKKAAGQGPNAKARPNDAKVGDKKIIPSATPVKESSRLDGIMNAYKSMQEKHGELPSKAHVMKMCKDGMSTAAMLKMHPDCDQEKLKAMIADCRKELKGDVKEAYESYSPSVIKAAKMYMKDSSCSYKQAAEKYGCSAEEVKKCASEMSNY